MLYNWHRYRDPATGGFTQPDPIGLAGESFSLYAALGGNPISNVDPDGLQAIPIPVPLPLPLPPYPGNPAPPSPGPSAEGEWLKERGRDFMSGLKNIGQEIKEMCRVGEDEATDDNCEALYQSTLRTCASLSGRKKWRCWEAARENREQCYREGKQ